MTTVALDSDIPGTELPAGTEAIIHEVPDENEGLYSIAVGNLLYDLTLSEMRPIATSKKREKWQRSLGDRTKRICAQCGNIATKRCTRCKSYWYCGAICQQKHWKQGGHKYQCLKIVSKDTNTGNQNQTAVTDVAEESRNEHDVTWLRAVQLFYTAIAEGHLDIMQEALAAFGHSIDKSMKTFARKMDGMAVNEIKEHQLPCSALAARLIFYGASLIDSGRNAEACTYLQQAIDVEPSLSSAYLELCVALEAMGDLVGARKTARLAAIRRTLRVSPCGFQRPGIMYDKNVRSVAFWNSADIPWVRELENNAPIITEELLLMRNLNDEGRTTPQTVEGAWHPVGGSHRTSGRRDGEVLVSGSWHEQVIFGAGGREAIAPRTAAILRRICPDAIDLAKSGGGEVIFSRLAPGSHISAHCAPTNFRLTCHLGLVVPSNKKMASGGGTGAFYSGSDDDDKQDNSPRSCAIRVGKAWRSWKVGEALIFDDSFEHEVVNWCQEERIVLLIRFWHPDIYDRDRALQISENDLNESLRLRKFPPLATTGCSRVEQYISGQEPCPRCGERGTSGWALSFPKPKRKVLPADCESDTSIGVVATCGCGFAIASPSYFM